MVAVLSTISRMTLLALVAECISQLKWGFLREPHKLKEFGQFDEASRGVYGSLILLGRFSSKLAALGAFITLVATAFGTLSQQVLNLEAKNFMLPNSSAIFGLTHEYATLANEFSWGNQAWPLIGRVPRLVDARRSHEGIL
jgi:hypothetical protein